jgi:hypothetical protein
MTDRAQPDDERPARPCLLWVVVAVVAVFVVRLGLHAVSRVADVAWTVVVLGVLAAVAWHFTVGARHRRRRP